MLNVFEHQRFRLRRPPSDDYPNGERVTRSFREIITGDDEPLLFDYPLEYLNVAALGLCVALAQTTYEPETVEDLEAKLTTPLTDEEYEQGVAPLRDLFTIDGPSGTRFLQGPEPEKDKKGPYKKSGSLSDLLLTVKRGNKTFLNRPDEEWAVELDQVPLLLFARHTFFEGNAGRGYLNGTSHEMGIRTFLLDAANVLRRSIWLNVLARETQAEKEGDYQLTSSGNGFDGWLWHEVPDLEAVVQGDLTLRAGLLWQTAHSFVVLEEVEKPCPSIVTGERITGKVGTAVVVNPSGIGYGVRPEPKARRESFFRHPNAPTFEGEVKDSFIRSQLKVEETSGLIGHMAGLFFGPGALDSERPSKLNTALVLDQWHEFDERPVVDLLCFGFEMQGKPVPNVHSGYRIERFRYPLLGGGGEEETAIRVEAEAVLAEAAEFTRDVERVLSGAIQRCTLVQVKVEEDEKGRQRFTPKEHLAPEQLARSAAHDLWRHTRNELAHLLRQIEAHGQDACTLAKAAPALLAEWRDCIARHARSLFQPVFDTYSASPQHLVAAHRAKGFLLYKLNELQGKHPEPKTTEAEA